LPTLVEFASRGESEWMSGNYEPFGESLTHVHQNLPSCV
jgi:hypothetical protein